MSNLRQKKTIDDLGKDRLVLGVCGREGVGKTHLALTFPEPIFLFNFDKSLEGTLSRFKDKEVYYADYEFPSGITPETKSDILEQFLKDYWDTILEEEEGTIVIDTFTHVWDLIYSTVLEKIRKERSKKNKDVKVYPFDYAEANSQAESMLTAVYRHHSLNMCVTERMSQVYDSKGNAIPGRYKAKGYKGLPYTVQAFGTIVVENGRRYYRIEKTTFNDIAGTTEKKVYSPDYDTIKYVLDEM